MISGLFYKYYLMSDNKNFPWKKVLNFIIELIKLIIAVFLGIEGSAII